jgi:protein-disulfide isomerase
MTRSKAAERRQERVAEKRRQRITTLALAIGGTVVLLVVLVIFSLRPMEAPIPEGTSERYEGVLQGRTDAGYPRLGDATAPVTITEYSSFSCPACKTFHDEAMQALVDRVRLGSIQLVFVPLTTGSIANARGAAAAAICVAEQGKFWEMHDALFSWHGLYGNQAFTNNRIIGGLAELGLDQNVYNACLGSGRPSTVIDSAASDANGLLNYVGTPTIAINGIVPTREDGTVINDAATIITRIDEAIALAASAEEPSRQQEAVPTAEPGIGATDTPPTAEATSGSTAEPTVAPTQSN